MIFSATPVVINFGFPDPVDVYGLQVSDVTGSTALESWWFDIDDDTDGLEDKGLVGDVEYADRCAIDEEPPTFDDGCPDDKVVECPANPAPPMLTASDSCDPDPSVSEPVTQTMPGPCEGTETRTSTWTATDCDGNVATCEQVVSIVDTTPPSVTPGGDDLACLWPPNHWYVCFSKSDFAPMIDDDCDMAPEWRFAGCASDQCDDAPCPENPGENGDGATTNDCMVSDDWICVRAERAGTDRVGRRYGVSIIAVDDCGNESDPTVIGNLYVPHDQKPHEKGCRKTTKDGCMTPTFPPVAPAAPCD